MKRVMLLILICSIVGRANAQFSDGTVAALQDSGVLTTSWIQQQSPISDELLNVGFLNPFFGWSGPLVTTNGGVHWEVSEQKRVLITFSDSLHGWSESPKGSGWISRTVDGGKSWMDINTGLPNPTLFYFSSASRGFCLDYQNARIARSNDSGKTWKSDGPFCGLLLGFVSFDSTHIFAAGGDYTDPNPPYQNINGMFYSSDGGDHWMYSMKSPLPNSAFKPFGALDSAHLYFIGGPPPHASFSTDRGYTLKSFNLPPGSFYASDGQLPMGGCAIDTNNIVIVGEGGKIYRTFDGKTWIRQLCPVNSRLRSVVFVDSLAGWIVGEGGVILHTTNGGNSWVSLPSISDNLYASISQLIGLNQLVLRYTLPTPQRVSLSISDIDGRTAAYLDNEVLQEQGLHERVISTSSLPAGTFFLRIHTEKYQSIVKFVVVR